MKSRAFEPALRLPFVNGYSERSPANVGMETVMALKVELKPGERIIIGESVVTN